MTSPELILPPAARRGRAIQEWLSLNGHSVVIDGIVGPATRAAIAAFRSDAMVKESSGEPGDLTWSALVAPMASALKPADSSLGTLARWVVYFASQHLRSHPREVGGANRGPWVRMYMAGNEGPDWPWCAGFATFIVKQAAEAAQCEMPIPVAYGCDFLADKARAAGRFQQGIRPSPGWLFLVPGKPNHWSHIGIVMGTDGQSTMTTIEGNTNDDGSPDGYEVCKRTRTFKDKGFIAI